MRGYVFQFELRPSPDDEGTFNTAQQAGALFEPLPVYHALHYNETDIREAMTTKTISRTLIRWHKVTERLNKEYSDLSKAAKAGLMNTTVTEYLGEVQEARLLQHRDKCLAQFERALAIQDVVTRIRQALGEANDRTGVSRELAEYDKLVKRTNLLSAIFEGQTANLVTIDELKQVKNPPRSEEWRDRGQTKIAVGLLEGKLLENLKAQAEETTAAMYAQADRVADLNKTTLSIELPVDVARIAGL